MCATLFSIYAATTPPAAHRTAPHRAALCAECNTRAWSDAPDALIRTYSTIDLFMCADYNWMVLCINIIGIYCAQFAHLCQFVIENRN